MLKRMRGPEEAIRAYDGIAAEARQAGRRDIAAVADLRSAVLAYATITSDGMLKRVRDIAASTDPEERLAASLAKIFLSQVARRQGREAEADALLREAARNGTAAPLLIYSPPYELTVREIEQAKDANGAMLAAFGNPAIRYGGNFEDMWVDIGFWVQPDGSVTDAGIVRKHGSPDWAEPLLRSVRGRRYAALSGGVGAYRLERYTYTSGYESRLGSHIPQRSSKARVEYLDLTAAETAPAAQKNGPPR